MFYAWETRAEEGALEALRRKKRPTDGAREHELESQLQELRGAVTELLTENLPLKNGRRPQDSGAGTPPARSCWFSVLWNGPGNWG